MDHLTDRWRLRIIRRYIALVNKGECRKMAMYLTHKEFRERLHRRRCFARCTIYAWADRFGVKLPA